MKCSNCDYENQAGASHCGMCGLVFEKEVSPLKSPGQEFEAPDRFPGAVLYQEDVTYGYAGVWRRFFATWLDNIIQGVLFAGPYYLYSVSFLGKPAVFKEDGWSSYVSAHPEQSVFLVLMYVLFGLGVLGYGTFFMGKFGGSPGQRILGMKTLSGDGGRLGYGGAFFRTLIYQIFNVIPLVTIVSFFAVIFSNRRQALHDRVCNTIVVRA